MERVDPSQQWQRLAMRVARQGAAAVDSRTTLSLSLHLLLFLFPVLLFLSLSLEVIERYFDKQIVGENRDD